MFKHILCFNNFCLKCRLFILNICFHFLASIGLKFSNGGVCRNSMKQEMFVYVFNTCYALIDSFCLLFFFFSVCLLRTLNTYGFLRFRKTEYRLEGKFFHCLLCNSFSIQVNGLLTVPVDMQHKYCTVIDNRLNLLLLVLCTYMR